MHLRDNRLTTLPDSIGELRDLRQLDLRGNPLTTLPSSLFDLPRLDKLDLRWVPALPPTEDIECLKAHGCIVYT
jgi:hypothetical protein